jgi:polysaccharide export outer membrane protein
MADDVRERSELLLGLSGRGASVACLAGRAAARSGSVTELLAVEALRGGTGDRPGRGVVGLLVVGALAALGGCASDWIRPEYVSIEDYDQPFVPDGPYLISPGDLLSIRVQGQDGMSGKLRVRDDGKISLQFLNDVPASGLTPLQLAERIQVRLREFVVKPVVVVSLEETRPLQASVVGNVKKAGTFQLEPRSGVLQALAAAGGLGEFADPGRIFVLRHGERIRFTYKSLTQADRRAVEFRLRAGDVIVVE